MIPGEATFPISSMSGEPAIEGAKKSGFSLSNLCDLGVSAVGVLEFFPRFAREGALPPNVPVKPVETHTKPDRAMNKAI
jgi:hypothetical protein